MSLRRVSVAVVAAAVLLGGASCKKAADGPGGAAGAAAARVVPVLTAVVEQRDVPIFLDGLGSVLAWKTVQVRSQVDGKLDSVAFHEGQAVHRGDLLAQIDPRPFLIQLHNAEGALARDQANLKAQTLNLTRNQDLRGRKLIAQQLVDDQASQVGQLDGVVRIDQANIESARLNLAYARIVAPIDGVTGLRQVDPGNIVHAADATGIVLITQLDPIAVIFTLPEDNLPQIAAQLSRGELPVEAWSRDGGARLSVGKLELVDNQINASTATVKLKAVFANPQHTLWPNQFIKARLQLSAQKDALVVPSTAVQRGPDGTFAYVVNADQTVQPRNLEVTLTQGEFALIGKGLKAGEVVVTDGQNQLRPGAKVAPRQAAAKQQQPAGKEGRLGTSR